YFYNFTTIEQKRLAVLIHALAAIVIICVWIVHVYAAIWVRGTIRGMTRGYVTGGCALRPLRQWVRGIVAGKALRGTPWDGPQQAPVRRVHVAREVREADV